MTLQKTATRWRKEEPSGTLQIDPCCTSSSPSIVERQLRAAQQSWDKDPVWLARAAEVGQPGLLELQPLELGTPLAFSPRHQLQVSISLGSLGLLCWHLVLGLVLAPWRIRGQRNWGGGLGPSDRERCAEKNPEPGVAKARGRGGATGTQKTRRKGGWQRGSLWGSPPRPPTCALSPGCRRLLSILPTLHL